MEDKFHFNPMHILRGAQGLLSILALGLLAHVAQWYNYNPVSQSSTTPATQVPNGIAFAIFVSVMTLLITLPYVLLTPRFFPHLFKSHTKYTILFLESLSMILWFAAFVSVAAFLGKLSVCRGDVCHCAKAGAAFAAISWLSWGVTSLFALRFCLGMGAGASGATAEGIGKGERTRERIMRGLKLHNVWTGHGRKGQEDQQSQSGGYSRNDWEMDPTQNRF